MKRWLPIPLAALAVGAGLVVAWPHLFAPSTPIEQAVSTKLRLETRPSAPPAPGLDPTLLDLMQEFDAGKSDLPSPASRKLMLALAEKGADGHLPVPLVEAWLRRMHRAGLAGAPEFRELAQNLLRIDASATQHLVAECNRQDVVVDRAYQRDLLTTWGKACLPAVLEGLVAVRGPTEEARSLLPVVLARLGDDALPEVRQSLGHSYPHVRRQAVRALALMSPDQVRPAWHDLEAALRDMDPSVRMFAALALGDRGDSATTPRALTAALEDADALVRLAAARSLQHWAGFDAAKVATVVVALLQKEDFTKVCWELGSLSEQMRPYAESKGGLFYEPMYWQEAAANVLIELGPPYQLEPEVLLRMLNECPHDGRHLVHMLAMQGDKAKTVVPALTAQVNDTKSIQRRKALLALGRLGPGLAGDAKVAVRAALDHPDGRTRWRAFLTLAQLDPGEVRQALPASLHVGVDAACASPGHPRLKAVSQWTRCVWTDHPAVLLPATNEGAAAFKRSEPWTLSDEEVWTEKQRVDAILRAVEKDGPHGKAAVPLLLAAWQTYDRTPSDRSRHGDKALALLVREGAAAGSAVPAMINALNWHEPTDLSAAFAKIGDPAVIGLAAALEDADRRELHGAVLAVLQEIGPRAGTAGPALVRMLCNPDEALARQAAQTLGALGSGARETVPELQKLLASRDNDVRRHAVDALGLIGAEAKPALPALIGLFNDESQQIRIVAVRAVCRLGKDAVEPLTAALQAAEPDLRLGAVHALARLDAEARSAAPALRKLAQAEQTPTVRDAALELLQRWEAK